jgi:hypothetical protein
MQGVGWSVQHGAEKVVGFEPEKPTIPRFATAISEALDAYDVLVVGRTPAAEDTLPPIQQRTERLAGWILQQTHNLPHDALAGPRGFTVAGAEVLAQYPALQENPNVKMNSWLYLYKTALDARKQGFGVGGIDVDMMYPDVLVAEETGNPVYDEKRFMQFSMQLKYLLGEGLDRTNLPRKAQTIANFVSVMLTELDNATLEDELDVLKTLEMHFANYFKYQIPNRAIV